MSIHQQSAVHVAYAEQASRDQREIQRLNADNAALVAEVAALTAERDALRVPEQRGTT